MAVVEAFGTTITIDAVPIYGIGDISGPALSREVIDITNHSSPGGSREKRMTLLDYGDYSFPLVIDWADEGTQDLYAAIIANTQHAFVMDLPDGTTHTFNGKVSAWSNTAAVTDVPRADVTITPESIPTIVPAGS